MTYKSLLSDEIEVKIRKGGTGYFWWDIENSGEFELVLYVDRNFITAEEAKSDFIACARRNGWKKYKFVE